MLYLMMCQGKEKNMIKVGYTSERSCQTRRKDYTTHNPLAIMRSHCAGNKEAEKEARATLVKMGATREKGSEWFEVSDELFNSLYNDGLRFVFPKIKSPVHFDESM